MYRATYDPHIKQSGSSRLQASPVFVSLSFFGTCLARSARAVSLIPTASSETCASVSADDSQSASTFPRAISPVMDSNDIDVSSTGHSTNKHKHP